MKNYRENQPEWMRATPHGYFARRHKGTGRLVYSGPYIGKGSSLYRRPDERVYEDVCERMMQAGRLDASQIEVAVKDGESELHIGRQDEEQAQPQSDA